VDAHLTNQTGRPGSYGPAVACTTEQTLLGEGARWDARRGELLRVDILAGRVYRDRVAEDGALVPVATYRVPMTVGAITPVEGDESWLLAAGRGFIHLTVDGSFCTLAEVAPAGARMNDGACDPQGRFWAGTMAEDHHAGGGALYRLNRQGRIELMLGGLTIANGLGWSPDGRTMYLVDSGPRLVHAFAFDPDRGTISGGRVLVTVAEELGAPDGMTVDAAGDLWVAIYGGGRVHRYSPDGLLRQTVIVPAKQSTSCAFAGPGLNRLYVTTATEDWSEEQRRAEPVAGLAYRFDTDATGLPATPFRPDRDWWQEVLAQRHEVAPGVSPGGGVVAQPVGLSREAGQRPTQVPPLDDAPAPLSRPPAHPGRPPDRRARAARRLHEMRELIHASQGPLAVVGRSLRLFAAVQGVDRMMAIAAQMFIVVIPLLVVISSIIPGSGGAGDRLVSRLHLTGAPAESVRQLFHSSSASTGIGVLGLFLFVFTLHSLARALQRLYALVWGYPRRGAPDALDGLRWLPTVVLYGLGLWLVGLIAASGWREIVATIAGFALSTAFWTWTPWLLLGQRMPWCALLPAGLLTAVGLAGAAVWAAVYVPHQISTYTDRYGTIGVAIALVSYLVVLAAVIILGSVIAAAFTGRVDASLRSESAAAS
jgi:sugar lactone lactonase YvrE